jgi:hypothetical protein
MAYKISLSNYHKMGAPAVIGVAKNDAERALIGKHHWVPQLKVKGSVAWTEDTTPTLLPNMKTYLPMNNFGSTTTDGGNMVYDYKKNLWWKNIGQDINKGRYASHLGSKINNTHPPLTHLPSSDKRTCTTTALNAHMSDAGSRLHHLFYCPGATHKPNNDTSYLGKNYSVSMMMRVDRNAPGVLHQFQYAQASHSENWRLSSSGQYDAELGVMFTRATHIHNMYLSNKKFYIFTEAQGSTGTQGDFHYTGIAMDADSIPNNQWFHLLINVEGTQVQYHIVSNPLGGYTGRYLSTGLLSLGKYKSGNGANYYDNRSGGSHRGEWIRTVGSGIRVAELRGYNTNIRPGTKSAMHIMNHRYQIGDLPTNNAYPDEFIGDEFIPDESVGVDEADAYFKNEKSNLATDISNILVGNYSNNMILDKFGEFDNTHGTDFYSNVEHILNQELYMDKMSDFKYNIQNSDASHEIAEVKSSNNIDNL